MSNLSAFHASPAPRATQTGQPGSNGYWRRDAFNRPGTYTWTARKTGKIKIQAIGTGSGAASSTSCGSSGAFGEKELDVQKGQTLTLVLGAGGEANAAGGSTSISGVPVGGVNLVLAGATVGPSGGGAATGPWDRSNAGAGGGTNTGSPSSGSPFGPGQKSSGKGGAGWGGGAAGVAGGSTHFPASGAIGAPKSGYGPATMWDLADADSEGGSDTSKRGGVGAGGVGIASGSEPGIPSILGGGTGHSLNASPPKAGHGAGGGAGVSAGVGGDAFLFIFWDEVK